MGGQVLLAWLLSPDDFGVVGLASSIVVLVNLIREAGIKAN